MKRVLENASRRRLLRGKLAQKIPPHRLPWIKSENTFTTLCNQCGDCLATCENNIIKTDESGFPFVDFAQDECTFCGKCQEVCHQPLFIDKNLVKADKIYPWPATITINNKCLAQNNILCQSCQDVCDPRAITFSHKTSSIPEPTVNVTDCNQCGACISTCPQQAISLTLNNSFETSHA